MQTTFLNAAGTVLFVRDDMEQGEWTQEEYTVNATFPFVDGKVIERGQRMYFRDPATDNIEVFEIRNVVNTEPEHYQQIIAEHIVVSELSDEHINNAEITDKTPKQALTTVLTGTLWTAGTAYTSDHSSGDIARGSVWQAVLAIQTNWNCYIVPRVTIDAAGNITGRYLDITDPAGVWRGVRLSIDKNMPDSTVTYDDTETYTALYGYGGSVETTQTGADDKQEELTFKDVVWSATSAHPAKPAGQTYLEDPTATALYGRNGRPRFGYYQNSEIEDPNILLQKTWESLKASNKPKISISGTCVDLYRLGYHDEPIRLHDIAIVDIPEIGASFQLQIIKNAVDLLDPTATRPEIGDYIPNIVYINRNTNNVATTGTTSSGGGGGGGGSSGSKPNLYNTYYALESNTDKLGSRVGLVVGTRNGGNYIKAGQIAIAINNTGEPGSYETVAHINADKIFIGQNETIDPDFQNKTLDGSLTAITTDFTTVNTLLAKKIEADDITATFIQGKIASLNVLQVASLDVTNGIECQAIDAAHIDCTGLNTNTGSITCGDVDADDVKSNGKTLNVADASKSGNTLTITKVDGSTVTFSKAAALQAIYGGSNTGVTATYTVNGTPAENFPSGASVTGTFTLHINANAAWITDPNGTIRARLDNTFVDNAKLEGWNAACAKVTRSNNTIYAPTKDSYGNNAVKYTANYTASKYSASSYTASNLDYTSSRLTIGGDAKSSGTYNVGGVPIVYRGSSHSYTASSYSSESYTASSFSWS